MYCTHSHTFLGNRVDGERMKSRTFKCSGHKDAIQPWQKVSPNPPIYCKSSMWQFANSGLPGYWLFNCCVTVN